MRKNFMRLLAASCTAALLATSAAALSVDEAWEILQDGYVDSLPAAAREAQTLDELFAYTDAYTYYMTAQEYEAFLDYVESEESFAGIGAEIVYTEAGIEIAAVLAGGGAEKAGLSAAAFHVPRR